jgi:hypothetical protein
MEQPRHMKQGTWTYDAAGKDLRGWDWQTVEQIEHHVLAN